MTTQIKKTWRKVKLGEVALIGTGGTPSRTKPEYYSGGKNLWIKTQELNDGVIYDTDEKITDEALKNSNAKIYPAGSVVLAMYGATVGKLARLGKAATTNQACAVIQERPSVSDNSFLFYALLVNRELIIKQARGAAQQNLSVGVVKDFELNIPEDTDTQKRIANILSAFDDKIELNNKISAALEQMAQAIFKEWLLKNQKSNIKNQKLGDLVKIISGHPFSSKLYTKNKKALGVVTIKNVQDGNFVTNCDSLIREEDVPKNMNQECLLRDGDILLSLTGNVGRVCFVYGEEYLLNQRVAKLKPKNEVDHAFYYFLFRQVSMQNQLINMAKGSAQPNLSPIETGEIEMAIPPREILDRFSELASPIYQRLIKNAVENQKLAALRDLLLPKLMSGEIRV